MWVWMVKKGSKVAKVWALEGIWLEKVSPKEGRSYQKLAWNGNISVGNRQKR
jgi:hypothetical protein